MRARRSTEAIEIFQRAGYNAVPLPVSHAFHTSIVAPASEPLGGILERLHLESPRVPIVANVSGEFYPTGPDVVPQMLDISRGRWRRRCNSSGLRTLYEAGARVFVEVGPKKALHGFAEEVLGDRPDVVCIVHQSSQARRHRGLQSGAVRPLCGGTGTRGCVKTQHQVGHALSPANPWCTPVAITGASLGLPGTDHIFDDSKSRAFCAANSSSM